MTQLRDRHCRPVARDHGPLAPEQARALLTQLDDWALSDGLDRIERRFQFDNYYRTTAFVNAVVWMVHQQDHHPEIRFGYNFCHIGFSTHSVAGLSDNDFICAARVDALFCEAGA